MVTTLGNSPQSVSSVCFVLCPLFQGLDWSWIVNLQSVTLFCFRLKMYVRTPFDHVKVFMKAEGRKANSVR